MVTTKYRRLAAVFLILSSVATSAPTIRAQNASDAYRASELIERWQLIVNETFESLRAFSTDEFEDVVTSLIDQFLGIGAVRAIQDRATEAQLKNADAAVKRLATTMVEAGNRQTNGSTQVTEKSFEAARKKICPQYPFCQ